MNNKHLDNRSILSYFYRPMSWLVSILIIIIFLVIGCFAFFTLIYHEAHKIKHPLSVLNAISDQVEHEVTATQKLLILNHPEPSGHTSSKKIARETNKVLVIFPHIFAIAYATNPKYKKAGFYLYQKKDKTYLQPLQNIYNKLHTYYYDRPWFIKPLKTQKDFIIYPQKSWFGLTQAYTMTYAFPFIGKDNSTLAVGAIDLNINDIFTKIQKSIDLTEAAFFIEMMDNNLQTHYARVSSFSQIKTINDASRFDNINNEWQLIGLSLYKKESLIFGGLNIVVKINLAPIIISAILFLVLLIVLFSVFLIVSTKLVNRKISKLTAPIVALSQHMSSIVENDKLDQEIDVSKVKSIEIQKLFAATEKMRRDISRYLKIQADLKAKQSQLDFAKKIQSIFMSEDIDLDQIQQQGLDIAIHYIAASDLSGDIYEITRHKQYIYIFIGDATGKDAAASIFGLFLLMRFKFLITLKKEPKKILELLNDYLCRYNTFNMFVTCVCIRINIENGEIIIANAGHDKPLIMSKNKEIIDIFDGNLVLGIDSNVEYEQATLNSDICHSILLYTDGISEARSSQGLYGVDRIINHLYSHFDASASKTLEALLNDIECFKNPDLPQDDETAILIKLNKDGTNENK